MLRDGSVQKNRGDAEPKNFDSELPKLSTKGRKSMQNVHVIGQVQTSRSGIKSTIETPNINMKVGLMQPFEASCKNNNVLDQRRMIPDSTRPDFSCYIEG